MLEASELIPPRPNPTGILFFIYIFKFGKVENLFCNALEYILELKERESSEERIDFCKNIIGLNDDEIKYYGVDTY
jgi:hypothetical protein